MPRPAAAFSLACPLQHVVVTDGFGEFRYTEVRPVERRTIGTAWAAMTALLLLPGAGAAQASGDGFLFEEPRVTLSVRGGWSMARAGSEIFEFVQDELTLDRGDFDALALGGELALRVSDRVDLTFGLDRGQSRARSEFRDWVGADDLPIEQSTEFLRTALTVGARYNLTERGRSVSRFAWIPANLVPWVGGGGGLVVYSFRQDGEFIDYDTFDIFVDRFDSEGTSPMAYLSGGLDLAVAPRWVVSLQGRYGWASSGMDQDFVGFDDIDLSGFQASVGLGIRF